MNLSGTASSTNRAIVVLTRGYAELWKYKQLMDRNTAIWKQLFKNDDYTAYDILIFHEGNILPHHQVWIQSATPKLPLQFRQVTPRSFNNTQHGDRYRPFAITTKEWSTNYRHMCYFWFVDFWEFVADYDAMLRIDEDCIVNFPIACYFGILELKQKLAIFGKWTKEPAKVTMGLQKYVSSFLHTNAPNSMAKQNRNRGDCWGPYSNVMYLNLSLLRKETLVQSFVATFGEDTIGARFLYKYRWGDLALWGRVLLCLVDTPNYISVLNLPYFHGSHNTYHGSAQDQENVLHTKYSKLQKLLTF